MTYRTAVRADKETRAESASPSRVHIAEVVRGDSWTPRLTGRYSFRMYRAPVPRSSRRLSWRAVRRLSASWLLAAAVSVPVPAAAVYTGTWRTDTDSSVVGRHQTYIARYEDTLLDIARRFGMGLAELRLANPGVDIWLPGEGTAIRLPSKFILPEAPRSGLVVNVAEMRIYYYPKGESIVRTWPISIGRVGWETPLGQTTIVRKKVHPTWYPPESIREEAAMQGETLPRAIGPGPDNPLGSHALYLGFPKYLIHGTNKPYSIGMRVSHGCLRMYPEDIVELFEMVGPGTPVTLVHQRIKAGWAGDELYMEVHPIVEGSDSEARPSMTEVVASLIPAISATGMPIALDWSRIDEALATANGIPVAVASRSAATTVTAAGQGAFAD